MDSALIMGLHPRESQRRSPSRTGRGRQPEPNPTRCTRHNAKHAKSNRKKQAVFQCLECGLIWNADANAGENVRVAAMTWLLAKTARAGARRGAGSTAPRGRDGPVAKAASGSLGRTNSAAEACPEAKARRTNR